MSEPEIINLSIRGDRQAQRTLYNKCYGSMMGLCQRYSKNNEQAKDMFRKGFIKLLVQISSYKNQETFAGWIKVFFLHHAIDYLKENRSEYYIATTVRADDKSKSDDLFNQNELEDPNLIGISGFIKALQELPPSFRSIYNLAVVDGLSHRMISECLEVSEATSKQNLEKARFQFLRNVQMQQKGYS